MGDSTESGTSGAFLGCRLPLEAAVRELADEETSAVILLAKQLAVTLNSGLLQAERLAAERRALQSEKLSTLGLLASSIAHEVKNPLSSIKTIATVMHEQLGEQHEHSEDLRLILEEIDRLSRTTSELLQFARPASSDDQPSRVEPILSGTMQVMRHLAKQRGVHLELAISEPLSPVRAGENAAREIFFNLLSNAIEAAGEGGSVKIDCQQENGHVVTRFHDTGPGISPADQDQEAVAAKSPKPVQWDQPSEYYIRTSGQQQFRVAPIRREKPEQATA